MPLDTWLPDRDFADVVDTLEPIKLLACRHGAAPLETPAWRFSESVAERSGTHAGVLVTETTWQLPTPLEGRSPEPGDVILDSDGGCSTVLRSRRLRGGTRHVCDAVRLRIAEELTERVDHLRPRFAPGEQGPTVVGFTLVRPAIRCLATSMEPLGADTPGASAAKVRLTFLEPLELRASDRLRLHRGGEYSITKLTAPIALGEPYEVEAELAS